MTKTKTSTINYDELREINTLKSRVGGMWGEMALCHAEKSAGILCYSLIVITDCILSMNQRTNLLSILPV